MSKAISYYLVALVVSVWLIQQVVCKESAMGKVYEKLDAYARGSSSSSGLTADDIRGALEEWKSIPKGLKQLINSTPRIKLTIDFVVHPMEVVGYQIEDAPEYMAKFVERAEKAYKLFRPAYVDGEGFGGAMVRADKFFLILNAAEGKLARDALTIKDFYLAKREFEDWSEQLQQITMYEDVYSMIPHLKKLFNYFNDPFLKALSKGVFPHMTKDSNVDQLFELFFKELQESQNIVLLNGRWTRYV